MNYREFYNKSSFTLFAHGDSNWDIYVMSTPGYNPSLVALAKPGSGAQDCCFGGMDWIDRLDRRGVRHGYVRVSA